MTGPTPEAAIHAKLVIDTSDAARQLREGLNEAEAVNRRDTDKLGEKFGARFSEAMGNSVKKRAPDIVAPIAHELETLAIGGGAGGRRRFLGMNLPAGFFRPQRALQSLGRDISRFVRTGGLAKAADDIVSSLFSGISSGVASVFNVGGKSPLIALLIPAFGALIGLIGEAIQGVYLLTSLLYAIPNVLFAIGLQAGVLFLIFGGLAQKIGTVFAAKGPKELADALKQLNPEVAKFVQGLLPFRNMIKQLQDLAQTSFFREFGQSLAILLKQLGPSFTTAVTNIAEALGRLFATFTQFFGSPLFIIFFEKISASTVKWIDGFNSALEKFLEGFHRFAIAVEDSGFIDKFGQKFNEFIGKIGDWFDKLANNPEFQQWLSDTLDDIQYHLIPALFQVGRVIKAFVKMIDKAGGNNFLHGMTAMFVILQEIFENPLFIEGMKVFLALLIVLTAMFIGILAIVLLLLAPFGKLLELIFQFIDWVRGFDKVLKPAEEALQSFGNTLVTAFTGAIDAIGNAFNTFFTETVPHLANQVLTFFTTTLPNAFETFLFHTLPDTISEWVGDFFSADNPLFNNAGGNIVRGLANGMRAAIPFFTDAMRAVMAAGREFWPFSPAKVGPLSGSGDPMLAGQNIINRLAAGMTMATPQLQAASNNSLSNIFMPGSINVGFSGALPTTAQATATGGAVGRGILGQMQDTRLGVRTL